MARTDLGPRARRHQPAGTSACVAATAAPQLEKIGLHAQDTAEPFLRRCACQR
ncbi:MAG: hypothetical protein U0Z44_14465 [Kouleothrix sp.]